jgi:hypothetical protein
MGMLTDKPKPGHNSLEHYFADDAATEALALVKTRDPDAARDALLLAAGYIQRGEVLPGNLADFLVNAIEAAMAKPTEKQRAKTLTVELGLTGLNSRPVGSWATVGGEVESRVNAGESPENACIDVSAESGISDRTVKRYWDKYKKAAAQFDADMKKR